MRNLKKLMFALGSVSAAAAAFALTPGIGRAADPLTGLLMGGNTIIAQSYQRVWTQVQSAACRRIRDRIEQPGALAKGTTAYDTSCTFGGPGTLAFDASKLSAGSLGFTYFVPANAIDFRTKTPFGKWADPKFHVTYDLGITSHVGASPAVPPLSVTDATAAASNVKVRGGNISGTLAAAFISPAVNESVDLKSAFNDAIAANWRR